jgi:vitamin B12/bleomycin/antimicrobial peptide transport system ATP-binding/permease protein
VAIFRTPTADKADYTISRLLLRRIWRLAKPYWWRKEAWRPFVVLAFMLGSIPVMGTLSVRLSFIYRDLTDALVAKHAAEYWRYFWFLLAVTTAQGVFNSVLGVAEGWMMQDWRRWLTTHLLDQYLARRTYYDIAQAEDLDNPDQRIQENVQPFIAVIVGFPRMILARVTILVAGIYVLSRVSGGAMFPATIGMGVLQAAVIWVTYVPTIKKNYNVMLAEADFRYGILHVRDHAEAIAFYSGEATERVHLMARLKLAIGRNLNLLYYNALAVTGSHQALSVVWQILPYLILVPIYLAGHLSYGGIAQATNASLLIIGALSGLLITVPAIAGAAPMAVRLAQIQERFDAMEQGRKDATYSRLDLQRSAHQSQMRLRNVTLETPAGEQTLVRDLSLTLGQGENLVVVGQTGVGKSSLLRAVAGLWNRGSGTIEMPAVEACLFLPQRPYMILADLRSQLVYPHGDAAVSDVELQRILDRVMLPDLAEKHGGLAAIRDWGRVLSLGEQQRIGFARMLVSHPKLVFLDEATSAVDFATETTLYQLLVQSGASFVSIGHRLSILDYHTHVLTLFAGGGWKLGPLTGALAEEAKECLDPDVITPL